MAEMNRVSRFFVNRSAARRAAARYEWIRQNAAVTPSATCLEVGCGNGELAARVVSGLHPAKFTATDFDPRQVAEAGRTLQKRFGADVPRALELRTADMLHLPFPDGSYDVVMAFVAIHHASEHHLDFTKVPEALSELGRVLRPGGALVYSEIFHKEAIRKWLTDHGFTIEASQRRWRAESVVARKPTAG
jgi:ubiquinone/menaquinone biosynthesis C-methylase UbiE